MLIEQIHLLMWIDLRIFSLHCNTKPHEGQFRAIHDVCKRCLTHSILQDSQLRAENCLKFISLLQGPCEELKAAQPSAIPALLPRLLTTIRIIWNNSEHYKSRERLNGLFRRVRRVVL